MKPLAALALFDDDDNPEYWWHFSPSWLGHAYSYDLYYWGA
jgi:hypothetical protein